ncbi:hypothetical protein NERG_02507 [Nematocida ausubeli]|uniref:tRNA (adenine(58)-N(1))-methyltransferase non-catalytic subunit TRM6 n=1 Tax=Nematocida ausubeli (strain ATCC PRA-371 / ERTm2) TaxID=1913371 RepID=H8ZFY6_NEMA1|nr:hypothetical protein NERG_02507 [Nematocida ausubeli]
MKATVTKDTWVLIHTADKGPIKCVGMKRDALRTLSLGRRGTFPVSALIHAPLNTPLVWSPSKNAFLECTPTEKPTGKHAQKKFAKHSTEIVLTVPTLPGIVAMYLQKGDLSVSHEAVSQILFHAIGTKCVVVKDDHKSVILSAVAAARGTQNLYRMEGHTKDIHVLGALGYPMEVMEYICPQYTPQDKTLFKNTENTEDSKCIIETMGTKKTEDTETEDKKETESIKNTEDAEDSKCIIETMGTKKAEDSKCTIETEEKNFKVQDRRKGFLLVLAQRDKYKPEEVLHIISTIPETFTSGGPVDFIIHHTAKEGILDLFNSMMSNRAFCLLDLRELFYREYQSTLGALHPIMCRTSHSGFILTGTFLNK